MLFKKILLSTLSIFLLSLSAYTMAEQSVKTNDGYVIHYNAVNNDFLYPETAKAYRITRSKNRAFLNISVKTDDNQSKAVPAKVTTQAVNLSGQLKTLQMREIIEANTDSKAIYYIGDFRFANQETIMFTVNVDSEFRGSVYTFEFVQQFFVK